ncbi:MAG: RNA exonuclease 3 [Trizodia sp. TS-e1964]|nr:MAG: RNA exonuclease 3 [Trizodia sp. TS-e1964]
MFNSLAFFSEIPCPDGQNCTLLRCLFLHQDPQTSVPELPPKRPSSPLKPELPADEENGGPLKRRKIGAPPSIQESGKVEDESTLRSPSVQPPPLVQSSQTSKSSKSRNPVLLQPKAAPQSFPLIPPKLPKPEPSKLKAPNSSTKVSTNECAEEALNPRMISQPPASHSFRYTLLTAMHNEFIRLNELSKQNSSYPTLGKAELITMALDDEERFATDKPSIYSNVAKNQIMKLKRMNLDGWKGFLTGRKSETSKETLPISLETGLTKFQELELLARLVASTEQLKQHGFVTAVPTLKEISEAEKGIAAACGWEECDRCKTRFQVFPGRRLEDGALTTGGTCCYHYGKPIFPPKSGSHASKASKEKKYSCCNQPMGTSTGCVTARSHVFKVSEIKRLASILPFEITPPNPNPEFASDSAVCLDCEMGYTVYGLELIRLTATVWPSGEEVLDILVRPLGEILDLNSRFSGVLPDHITLARPYGSDDSLSDSSEEGLIPDVSGLRIVSSPSVARSLLLEHLSPTTPLIGHALENDLNAARLIHPLIVDSAILYPHSAGLPYRNSLRMLMSNHLDRTIQQETSAGQGHDSKEDARAAGELVRWRVKNEYLRMQRQGWTFSDGKVSRPSSSVQSSTK